MTRLKENHQLKNNYCSPTDTLYSWKQGGAETSLNDSIQNIKKGRLLSSNPDLFLG